MATRSRPSRRIHRITMKIPPLATKEEREAAWQAWKQRLHAGRPWRIPNDMDDALLCTYSELRYSLRALRQEGHYEEERAWCERSWKEILSCASEDGVPLSARWALKKPFTHDHERGWHVRLGGSQSLIEASTPTLLVLMMRTGSRVILQEAVHALLTTPHALSPEALALDVWRLWLEKGKRGDLKALLPTLLTVLSPEKLWEEWLLNVTHEGRYHPPALLGNKAWKQLCHLTGYTDHPPPCFSPKKAKKNIVRVMSYDCPKHTGAHLSRVFTQWPEVLPAWIQEGKKLLIKEADSPSTLSEEEVAHTRLKAYSLAFKVGFWSCTDFWSPFLKDLSPAERQDIASHVWLNTHWNPALNAMNFPDYRKTLGGIRRVDAYATLVDKTLGPPPLPYGVLCAYLKKLYTNPSEQIKEAFPSSAWWRAHDGPGYTKPFLDKSAEHAEGEHPFQWALSKELIQYLQESGVTCPPSGHTFARWCNALSGDLLKMKVKGMHHLVATRKALLTEGLCAPWGPLDDAPPGIASPRTLARLHRIPLPVSKKHVALSPTPQKAQNQPTLPGLITAHTWSGITHRLKSAFPAANAAPASQEQLRTFFTEDPVYGSALTVLLLSATQRLLALDELGNTYTHHLDDTVRRFPWPPDTNGGKLFRARLSQACNSDVFSEIAPGVRQECLKNLYQIKPVMPLRTWSEDMALHEENEQLFSPGYGKTEYWRALIETGPKVWGADADEIWRLLMQHVPYAILVPALEWIKEPNGEKNNAACSAWFDTPARVNEAFTRLCCVPPSLDQTSKHSSTTSLFVEAFLRYGRASGVHPPSFWRARAEAYFDVSPTPLPFTTLSAWHDRIEIKEDLENLLVPSPASQRRQRI